MRYSNYGIIRSNFICVHIFYSFPIRNVQQRRVLIVTGLVGRSHYITLTNQYCGGGAWTSLEARTQCLQFDPDTFRGVKGLVLSRVTTVFKNLDKR